MAHVDRSKIHPDLVKLVEVVGLKTSCKLICGYRGEQEQNDAFMRGNSKLKYPMSKHNKLPSEAIDLIPLPVDWNDLDHFKTFCTLVIQCANELGLNVVSFGLKYKWDYPHFQLENSETL